MKKTQRKNTKFLKSNKGFSLVETLVAIFILSLAITSAMAVAQGSLQASFYARDKILATFLAQEAIELIKNRRDQNGLTGNSWLSGIADWDNYNGPCGEDNNKCGVDINFYRTPSPCSGLTNCQLYQKISGDFYLGVLSHCSLTQGCVEGGNNDNYVLSGIFRKINMKKISPNEAEITVTVTWADDARKVEITEHIFNWHPYSNLEE